MVPCPDCGRNQQFVKADLGKPRMELLPPVALERISEVLTFGAKKYAPGNWRKVDDRMRYAGAALRHIFARLKGEIVDPESGLPHLAHAGCCILFWCEADELNLGIDGTR